MRNEKIFRFKSGQAIIEVMIAVTVLTVGFLGIVGLLSRSLGLNRVVSDNYTASYLAAEGIEVAKNILDHNAILRTEGNNIPWNQGFLDGDYEVSYDSVTLGAFQNRTLAYDPTTLRYGYAGPTPTSFTRRVHIATISQNELQISAVVTWITRGGGTFTVNLEDHFFNWRF